VLRRRKWFQGRPLRGADVADINWFDPSGEQMTDEQWQESFAKSLAVFLNGDAIPQRGPKGEPIKDDSLLILFNAWHEPIDFVLPPAEFGARWDVMLDTADPSISEGAVSTKAGDKHPAQGRSVVLLKRVD
jgi:glycogen operon protein